MDILLMPSNNKLLRSTGGVGNLAKFTSPLKLFDYMASGKLIIASNLKVFKEVIKHNENSIIINNLNIINWKREINKIRKNINKYNKIKKKSYFLSKQYTYLKRAKKILSDINIK
jgi:glycosyltransferase involved in cell wall biosynthesis